MKDFTYSDLIKEEGFPDHYRWNIDDEECNRISKLLDTDFARFGIKGTYLMQDRVKCNGCGKLSGFDDFVAGALKNGIHSREFMIHTMETGADNSSPPHDLQCMNCGKDYQLTGQMNAEFSCLHPKTWGEVATMAFECLHPKTWNRGQNTLFECLHPKTWNQSDEGTNVNFECLHPKTWGKDKAKFECLHGKTWAKDDVDSDVSIDSESD